MEESITKYKIEDYTAYLETEEKSTATQRQYKRDIQSFFNFAQDRPVNKELVIWYKQKLQSKYLTSSVNAKIAAINGFFSFIGRDELKVKQLKIQRKAFCSKEKELTKTEYVQLVNQAKQQKNKRLSSLIQTICGTGIRVSELKYITVASVWAGEATIRLKGKTRVILIAGKLRKMLKQYLQCSGITSGSVFVTKSGNPLDRSNIWKMMKALCERAGVTAEKVFPHNLRHLFARCFYAIDKDIAKLADILGHSNINTTRIYIVSSGREHRRRMEAMGLVV